MPELEPKVGAGKPVPMRCIVCIQHGSYYGRLVWAIELTDPLVPPTCSNHKVPQPLFPV